MSQKTTRVTTDWGELSIVHRQGYYYAIKKVRGVKRQIYLGKSIPSQERLEEVADEINLPGVEWVKRHGQHLQSVKGDRTDILSQTVEQLRKIESLATARGEDAIAKQLSEAIRKLNGIQKRG